MKQSNNPAFLLINKNKEQLLILEKYIKIQKKVLDKHEKSGNYDACRIVKYSILQMNKFKQDFEFWLKNNTLLILILNGLIFIGLCKICIGSYYY